MPAAVASARRAALLALKLQTLVRDHAGPGPVAPSPFPGGAALLRDGEAWVLIEDHPERGLGPATGLGRSAGRHQGEPPGRGRRWAAGPPCRRVPPAPAVWEVDGRALRAAPPSPRPTPAEIAPDLAALRTVIGAAGADPIEEHGVLSGEVVGLEVCRAVRDDDGTPRLAVGIGAHDREAFRLVHGDAPVDAGAGRRGRRRRRSPPSRRTTSRAEPPRPGAGPALAAGGGPVTGGADVAGAGPAPRAASQPVRPGALRGARHTPDGAPVVVVVLGRGRPRSRRLRRRRPRRARPGPTGRLLLAVPEGDDHPVTRGWLARPLPAEVVPVPSRRSPSPPARSRRP